MFSNRSVRASRQLLDRVDPVWSFPRDIPSSAVARCGIALLGWLETFPFPEDLTPRHSAAVYASNLHAKAIAKATKALVVARDRWLNPGDLVKQLPELVVGFPARLVAKDAEAEAILLKRTLTALYNQRGTPEGLWLDILHRALDEAVAAAYGWPADLPDDEVLARLLALNHERAESR